MFTWDTKTKLLFGAGKLKELHKEEMPGKKALIVISNGKTVKVNGILDRLIEQIAMKNVEYALFEDVKSNLTEIDIMNGVSALRENKCDFIIGLGGGSVMDAVKVIAAMATNEGKVWDYIQSGSGGRRQLKNRSLPYIEIATNGASGSEIGCMGDVSNTDTHEKIPFKAEHGVITVVDPQLMITVPPKVTAYQGFDALLHGIEGYISNNCNEASEMLSLTAISHISNYLPIVMQDPINIEARTKIAFSNIMSGFAIEVGSCTSEHALAYAMSGYFPAIPHGAALLMISEAYFSHMIKNHFCDGRFVTMARIMGKPDADSPWDFIMALKVLKASCGVSSLKMSSYGITLDDFHAFAASARQTMENLFDCDRVKISNEEIVEIFKNAFK